MALYRDEIFGPVLSVVRVETYDDAVRLISDNPYGNGVAIFTRDGGAARRFEHEVDAGMVGVNVPIPVPMAYYSFGGWKQSLFGDTHVHGAEGVHFYTRGKVVTSRWADPVDPRPRPRLPPNLTLDRSASRSTGGCDADRERSGAGDDGGDVGHEVGDGLGVAEVGELDDEAFDAGRGLGRERVGDLGRGPRDEAAPAPEPALGRPRRSRRGRPRRPRGRSGAAPRPAASPASGRSSSSRSTAYVGQFHQSAWSRTIGIVSFGPAPPMCSGGRGSWTGRGRPIAPRS